MKDKPELRGSRGEEGREPAITGMLWVWCSVAIVFIVEGLARAFGWEIGGGL